MKSAAAVPMLILMAACGDAKKPAAQTLDPRGRSNLINTPVVERLSEDQLRGLVARCRRYEPSGTARGPYSASYCDDAQAAWADSPIHMLVIPPQNAK